MVQVPTYTERTPLFALGRSRRPGCTSQPRQVPHKGSLWRRRRRRGSANKKVAQEPVGTTSPSTPSWIISSSRIVPMFVTNNTGINIIPALYHFPLSIHPLSEKLLVWYQISFCPGMSIIMAK